jgi:3-deoxy-D-manno-octulosonic-acid transferase
MSGEPLLEHVPHAGSLDYSAASRPSIYELLAADELRGVVQPAFRYVLAVSLGRHVVHEDEACSPTHLHQYLAQRYPRYLLRLVNRHEEVYAVVMLLIERHHVNKYSKRSSRVSAQVGLWKD